MYYDEFLVYALSCTQKVTTLCSSESEYMELSGTSHTTKWLRRVCQELKIPQQPTSLFQDKRGTIEEFKWGRARHFSMRKYIDVSHDYISDMIKEGLAYLEKISTQEVLVHFPTKPLRPASFLLSLIELDTFLSDHPSNKHFTM